MDLSDEIMGALRARLQWLAQLALSCRQVRAHLRYRGTTASRRQALQPTEPPPTHNYDCFTEFCRESASFPARVTLSPKTTSEQFIEHTVNQSLLMAERWDNSHLQKSECSMNACSMTFPFRVSAYGSAKQNF